MKSILSFILMIGWLGAVCQSSGNPGITNSTTNTVNALSVQKSVINNNQFYQQVNSQPSDAGAWFRFYTWLTNTKDLTLDEKKQQLAQTVQSSQKFIAGSWQFALMNFIQSGKRNKAYLDAALANSSDKGLIYPYAIHYAIISRNSELLTDYAKALNDLKPLSPALYEYHFNSLQSAAPNATVYAKGQTDLAPMAVLQQVFGVRKDVTLAYYEEKITDTSNAYLCLSAGKDIVSGYPGAGYTGLLVKISGASSGRELLQHSSNFSFTQLQALTELREEEQAIYKNYLPPLLLLYRLCTTRNDPAAQYWKELIDKTARLTGSTALVNKMMQD